MTSVNALNTSAYYQLGNSSNNSATNTQSLTSTLAQDLAGASSSNSTDSSAYLLDLSPSAQQYLSSSNTSSATASSSTSASFTLSTKQQEAITAILEKYKDAPYTQATYDSIQTDLQSAGLSASTLSMEDAAQSFNPTQDLIDDLNGNYSSITSPTADANSSTEQAKSSNYMQQILQQWQTISGNTGTPSTTGGTAAATSS